jgi:hypothetical protein
MPKESSSEKRVVVVDPKLIMERMLHYRERQHAWHAFKKIYWGIYAFIIGLALIYYNALGLTVNIFLGIAVLLFAVMFIISGLVESLHHKLMKKYG